MEICAKCPEEHHDIFLMNPFSFEPYPALACKWDGQVTVKGFGERAEVAVKDFLHESIPFWLSLQIIEFFCILLVQRKPGGQEFIRVDFV